MTKQTTTALVTCYNKANVVVRCVQSLVECKEIDSIIVYDDASTDASVALLRKSFSKNAKVKIVVGNINRGVAFSRNYLLTLAKGSVIVFIDGDDVVESSAKDLQIKSFKDNYDTYLSYSDYERASNSRSKLVKSGNYSYGRLKTHNFIPFSSVVTRNDEHISFETVHHEDYMMWLTYLKDKPKKAIEYFEKTTFTYNITDNSLSSNIWQGIISNYKIKRRIGIGHIEAFIRVLLYIIIVGLKRWN